MLVNGKVSVLQRVIAKMLCSVVAIAGKAVGVFIMCSLGALLSLHLEFKFWRGGLQSVIFL